MEAAISGPTVWYGSVQRSGATFKFEYNGKIRKFGTKVEMRQFVEFLFTL